MTLLVFVVQALEHKKVNPTSDGRRKGNGIYKSTNAITVSATVRTACNALSWRVSNLRLSFSLRPLMANKAKAAMLFRGSNWLLKLNIAHEMAVIRA